MSSQLVRALKSNPDDPQNIQLAREAWDDKAFYAPRKGEAIADWILTRFSRGPRTLQVLLDPQYWTLLLDVVTPGDAEMWTGPLFSRVSMAPIVVAYLKELVHHDPSQTSPVFQKCIEIIWPLAVPKITVEQLLDCFGALLRFLGSKESNEHILTAGRYIVTSYRRSLLVTALKKKICTLFIQEHLSDWTTVVSQTPTELHSAIRSGGLESLFNLDALRDSKLEQNLFDQLATFTSESVIPALPMIFTAYIQTARKYRGALFGQSANRDSMEDFCAAGFRFFSSCQTILSKSNSRVAVWACRASLLDVVNQENLLSSGSSPEHSALLRGVIGSALAELISSEKDTQRTLVQSIMESLSAITRIDYVLIGPFLSNIISRLLLLPATTSSALSLLDLILEYNVKTRTVDDYIRALFKAIDSDSEEYSGDPVRIRRYHSVALKSPILHPTHLGSLSKKVHDHLTPNQITQVAHFIEDSTEELWSSYNAERKGETEKKRRKVDESGGIKPSRWSLAARLSVTGRVAVPILASLSMDSLPRHSKEELTSLLQGFLSETLSTIVSKSTKAVRSALRDEEGEAGSSWADEVVAVAALQMQYALMLHKNLACDDPMPSDKVGSLLDSKKDVTPDFKLELLRRLLRDYETSQSTNIHNVLDSVLGLLKEASSIDLNRLALFHMLIQRWLPIIDACASEDGLETFISTLLDARFTVGRKEDSAPGILVSQCLASAEFWELANMRRVFLTLLDNRTAQCNNEQNIDQDDYVRLMAVFDALLLVPIDYLSRNVKVELIRRALRLDTALWSQDGLTELTTYRWLHSLRVLVNRLLIDVGPNEQPGMLQALQHLQKPRVTSSITEELLSATLGLAETCMITLLKNSHRNSVDSESLIRSYSVDLLDGSFKIRASGFERLVVILDTHYNAHDFPQSITNAITGLFNDLRGSLTPRLPIFSENLLSNEVIDQIAYLKVWRHVLMLGRWLGMKESDVPLVSSRLCAALASAPLPTASVKLWTDLCSAIFDLSTEETRWCLDHDRRLGHLELTLATYVVFGRKIDASLPSEDSGGILEEMEGGLTSFLRDTSVDVYQHALDLVSATLSRSHERDQLFAINLAAALLRDPPKNTLHPTQGFFTGCINTFNSRDSFTEGDPVVRLKILRFIAQRCRDRPATLRQLDPGGIWSLLAKMLRSSEDHDAETHTEIFALMLTICAALIRLRRDLVVLNLPHLAVVLQLLLLTMRSPRPNLGGKQTGVVASSLPRWVNIRQPLGVDEAKALARLLESLSTKTLVRVHASSNDPQKAESLAKPFSKHAAYVLKAYVQASNDPLCVLPVAVRKALQPGLFSLCGITNDFSRDALMASISDTGEKAILKGLWKDYEKQRYVGKG
ncbi:hypothetical protein PM082_003041 [Marasmius tenuissimus]|nr:hypothetical protein PM082_003041 [Marasmius tenuissimus]